VTTAPRVEGAVELLERSLGYTRVVLAAVTPAHLPDPTPCRGWDLARLLRHMDDALDAFTEAATGRVARSPAPATLPVEARVGRLQDKACALLGTWSSAPATTGVGIGDQRLPVDLLVTAAALEIAVHGWDVGQVVAGGPPLPEELAARLLPVAHALVGPADRGRRFAAPADPPPDASYDERLRAFLGRP
jgi:uncharacterized protein (TIGR03086 family)